mgnify:CR=1 FL=1
MAVDELDVEFLLFPLRFYLLSFLASAAGAPVFSSLCRKMHLSPYVQDPFFQKLHTGTCPFSFFFQVHVPL